MSELIHTQLEHASTALYLDYDQSCKQQKARNGDEKEDVELKAPEKTLKNRQKP